MRTIFSFLLLFFAMTSYSQFEALKSSAQEGYVDNKGVKIHYLTWGEGPLMIMLHGFPDFWYSWRHLIPTLAENYQVVALDLRGYNQSDKPKGVDQYAMGILMQDVVQTIEHFKADKAILVGNDWGGAIAWNVALYYPQRVENLIACNIPFPNNISRYLQEHPEVGAYARRFQEGKAPSIDGMVSVIPDTTAWKYYRAAFEKSDIEAMLNYYKASYPSSGNASTTSSPKAPNMQKIKCPVLMVYGLQDKALPPGMINDTWNHIDEDLTIYTIPDGGHFIQQEKPTKTLQMIKSWLALQQIEKK